MLCDLEGTEDPGEDVICEELMMMRRSREGDLGKSTTVLLVARGKETRP